MTEAHRGPGSDDDRLRVVFDLEPEDGWPPARSEQLWAVRVGEDRARLDNIPFFARGYALGDVVVIAPEEDGTQWVRKVVEYSDNCTIRILPEENDGQAEARQAVLETFAPFGVEAEIIEQFGLVALNVPSSVDIEAVKRLILKGAEEGRWAYEEGCVTSQWRAAG